MDEASSWTPKVVAETHVGGAEQVRSEWHTIRAVFHNFSELPSKRGEGVCSETMNCHGYGWKIRIHPGGKAFEGGDNEEEPPNLAVYLYLIDLPRDESGVKVLFNVRIPSNSIIVRMPKFFHMSKRGVMAAGWKKIAKREHVLDASKRYLVNGNLILEVDVQVLLDRPPTWTPTKTSSAVCSDMLKLLESTSRDDYDVTFSVGGEQAEEIFAHRTILKARAPFLADVVADNPDVNNPIPIDDVEPAIFRMLLRFIYGGELPSKFVLKEVSKSFIRAADKYGCSGLKLAAECAMASSEINAKNAAELILFADAMNCAMLKEAAMDFFVENAQEVMASDGFAQVKESPAVMAELMELALGGSKKRPAESPDAKSKDYKRMRVATLRQKLDEKGLDVDGSKEAIISRLEKSDFEEAAAEEAKEDEDGSDSIDDSSEGEDSDDE